MTSFSTHPLVTFNYSLEMEARRIIYLASRLPSNALQERGFIILPFLPKKSSTPVIYFPDLAYHTIPNFWPETGKLKWETPIQAPPKLISQVASLLRPKADFKKHSLLTHKLQKEWGRVEPTFWSTLKNISPIFPNHLKTINVYTSDYGPLSTFSLAKPGTTDITIYLRSDAAISDLIWSILTCIFRPHMESAGFSWRDCQISIDFLLHFTNLNCGIKYTSSVMQCLDSPYPADLRLASQRFIKKLHMPNPNQHWSISGHTIYYANQPINNLSLSESQLLNFLVDHKDQSLSYDTIANHLWPNQPEITNSAITKKVERLRRKLANQGIPRKVIQAHRGTGYLLIS